MSADTPDATEEAPPRDRGPRHAHTDLSKTQMHALFVVAAGETYGHEIKRDLNAYFGRDIQSAVYPALGRLVDCGLVEKRTDPTNARRYYFDLTDAGEDVVREEFAWLQERLFPNGGAE